MTPTTPIEQWFGIQPAKRPKPQPAYKRPPKEQPFTPQELRRAKQLALDNGISFHDGEPLELTAEEGWYRHHNWKDKRMKVAAALTAAGNSTSSLFAFHNCGAGCQVYYCKEDKRYRLAGSYCHCRHCEPCMKGKSSLIIGNLRSILASRPKATTRFITLTLKHRPDPLRAQIKRLYHCWKLLRNKPMWKATQKGGAATLEVKWCPNSKRWHPHLHIISEGNYLNTYDLAQQWLAITGDSNIVDIRLISADKDVAYYVGKYVTKGTNNEVWDDPAVAVEWVQATKGVRMCATFGTWRGYKLLAKPKEEPDRWIFVASLQSLVRRSRAGDLSATNLLLILEETACYNPHRKRRPKPDDPS
jgi:hypothetical protein